MPNGIGRLGLLAALLFLTDAADAVALACGVYQDQKNENSRLVIESGAQALELSAGSAPRRFEYRRAGAELQMADLEAGYVSKYKVDAGNRITDGLDFHEYMLSEPAACKPLPQAAATGTCRADLSQCLDNAYSADEATLQRWCEVEALPFACDKLIDLYQTQAKQSGPPEPEIEKPPVCQEGTPAFSEEGCIAAAKQILSEQIAKSLVGALGSMYADAVALSPSHLDQSIAMCDRTGSAKVCNNAAGKLWTAGRYLQARSALQTACSEAGDPDACKKAEPLQSLTDADQRFAPATQLPCGDYAAATGLMSELKFGDHGMIEGGFGSRMRARLENGLVRIRHDKGGDFVFRVLDAQRLLGIDSWNEFALYERQGGADRCSAPVAYVEKPLEQDCPAIMEEGGAKACCDTGKLQGCNALGNQRALQGDWTGAKVYYQQVCAQGVRTGCENLTQVYANAGDESVIDSLDRLCEKDPKHVACDVRETSNWEMLKAVNALQKLGDSLEAELPAEDDSGESNPNKN
ncbi:hypothetical protein [Pseudoxanthomonas sacheonensis]|uniref:hypothetical protein n=1 Tax=Pseudoxanthomonas sacheonensis TaxID=443615 RepID=UPI0013D12510|nr:hypothetical protein [Pseudoxanthomonas sacheonensis]